MIDLGRWTATGKSAETLQKHCKLKFSNHCQPSKVCRILLWSSQTMSRFKYTHRLRNNVRTSVNSIRLPRMTDHKCTWSVGVAKSTCMNTISFSWCLTYLTTRVWTSQFLFSISSLCTSSSQPIFFPHYFSPTSYICTTQPGFESSLENTFSWFFDLFLVLGMTLHILKMTTQNLKWWDVCPLNI